MSAVLGMIAASVSAPAAQAGSDPPLRWREVWAGADVSADVWLVYSGATIAPYGGIHDNGLRLRAVTGYGQYAYSGFPISKKFDATTAFGEVLAGYLVRWGPLTAKAFAGVSFIDHEIEPFDTENISISGEWGVKGVVELWYNLSPNAWASLDLGYSTAHDTGSVRMRSGYRITPHISLGAEAGLNVDGQAQCKMRLPTQTGCRLNANDTDVKSLLDFGRTGLFARYEWEGGEVSVSAGGMGQMLKSDGTIDFEPYVTANWILQF